MYRSRAKAAGTREWRGWWCWGERLPWLKVGESVQRTFAVLIPWSLQSSLFGPVRSGRESMAAAVVSSLDWPYRGGLVQNVVLRLQAVRRDNEQGGFVAVAADK